MCILAQPQRTLNSPRLGPLRARVLALLYGKGRSSKCEREEVHELEHCVRSCDKLVAKREVELGLMMRGLRR